MIRRAAHAPAAALAAVVLSLGLTGCDSDEAPPGPAATSAAASPDVTGTASGPTVPGYAYGTFPAVPMFALPDLAMLDSALAGFSIKVSAGLGPIPGVRVVPARCDQAGRIAADGGALTLYGDGSGSFLAPDGSVTNFGDGSGSYTLNGTRVTVNGDGSGSYERGDVAVRSFGDGAGSYDDGTVSVTLNGDGSGTYRSGPESITNYGDGTALYENGQVRIHNYGDGSAEYADETVVIHNYGDGTATVNDVWIKQEPVEKVPPLGRFPAMGSIRPVKSCGSRIIIDDSVLFDFDSATLRPRASATLARVATALTALAVPAADVQGHTDARGSDTYNLDPSGRRAASVAAALKAEGVTAALTEQGLGEKHPVAPNQVDGKDNPAGRQLNRRVEIVMANP